MCGITGWFNLTGGLPQNSTVIRAMTETLANRGPDEEGYYIDRYINLGHKRLTVVDPTGGKQPMTKKILTRSLL